VFSSRQVSTPMAGGEASSVNCEVMSVKVTSANGHPCSKKHTLSIRPDTMPINGVSENRAGGASKHCDRLDFLLSRRDPRHKAEGESASLLYPPQKFAPSSPKNPVFRTKTVVPSILARETLENRLVRRSL
jgi:hypothetical protein